MTSLAQLNSEFPKETSLTTHNTFQSGSWLVKCPADTAQSNYFISSMVNTIRSAKPSDDKEKEIFIDLCDLRGWIGDFFKTKVTVDGADQKSITDALNDLVAENPGTPITIRYLDGAQDAPTPFTPPVGLDDMLKGLVNGRANVKAYYGFLGVTIGNAFGDKDGLMKMIQDLVAKNFPSLQPPTSNSTPDEASASIFDRIWNSIQQLIGILQDNWDRIISWNHCKILAINGTAALQGGANFWGPDYITTGPHDLLSLVEGDSAVSAHNWCNNLWQHVTSNNIYTWGSAATKTVPAFSLTPTNPTGKDSVLSLGEGAFMNDSLVTAQTAVLDALFNVAYYYVSKDPSTLNNVLFIGAILYFVEKCTNVLTTPRRVRYEVLDSAKISVNIHQQKLVMDDLWQAPQSVMDGIHKVLPGWDGNMWDFVLMYKLAKLSVQGVKVNILVSYLIQNPEQRASHGGYQDPVSSDQFLAVIALFGGKKENFAYHRIKDSYAKYSNHSKSFLVDDKILNIGSHNFYLGYNQEYEIYTDSALAVQEWKAYFSGLFN